MSFINRVLMAAVLAAGLWSPTAQAQDKTLRIGFQKYGTLVILKERGALEKRLKSQGYTVTWTEFPGGPQLLEALNVGAIDFGSTGEAPPIFAQAAAAINAASSRFCSSIAARRSARSTFCELGKLRRQRATASSIRPGSAPSRISTSA